MDIQRYRSHLSLLGLADAAENRRANDIDGSAQRPDKTRTLTAQFHAPTSGRLG
jgi:hypothetical protein